MATPIKITMIKKPDDWALRLSAGGEDGIGYYCIYRGNLRHISRMLTILHDHIKNMVRDGKEAPMAKEDGRHK